MSQLPRPASTVAIGRKQEKTGELEILLLLRSNESSFVPSRYVFPGGSIDPEDSSESLAEIAADDEEEELVTGFPDRYGNSLLTYKAAAVRETFEECGLLLGSFNGNRPVNETLGELLLLRDQLYEKKIIFWDLVHDLGLTLDNNRIIYLTNFVTPPFSPVRYDARFFFAEHPPGQDIHIDGKEIVDYTWKTPSEALIESDTGKLPMVFPTISVLRMLETFDSFSDFKNALTREKPFYLKIN